MLKIGVNNYLNIACVLKIGLNNHLSIAYILKYCENDSSGKQSDPRSLFKGSIL